jgi:hypothetical protein
MGGTSPETTVPVSRFTVNSLRELLRKHVLRPTGPLASLRMPSPEALAELASKLEYFTRVTRLARVSEQSASLAAQFREAVAKFEMVLQKVIEENEENLLTMLQLSVETRDPDPEWHSDNLLLITKVRDSLKHSLPPTAQRAETLELLRSAFAQIKRNDEWFDPSSDPWLHYSKGWKAIALNISACLLDALTDANPGFRPGISGDGPVPRFVAAVIPTITSEKPAPGYVGNFLKEHWPEEWRT